MKELHARAQSAVSASLDETLRLLRAVEEYPRWYPEAIKSATPLERDAAGYVTKVQAVLHVAAGPIVKDFNLTLAVSQPSLQVVKLIREPHAAGDQERFEVTWTVAERQLAVALDANLSVSRFLPIDPVGPMIANGFVNAAARALATGSTTPGS